MAKIQNSINNTIGASNSGATNTLTVQNPSNTASSSATTLLTVGGTSSGNVWSQYTVGTTRSYSLGINTSSTTNFSLNTSNSGTVQPGSGTEIFRFDQSTTPGTFIIGGGTGLLSGETVGIIQSNVGGNTSLEVENTDSTNSSSGSVIAIRTHGSTGGNPELTFDVFGRAGANFSMGILNDTSGVFKLVHGTGDLTASGIMQADEVGNVTFSLTSTTLYYKSSASANVTGDGTVYTLVCDTMIYDARANYNSSTGVWTAGVTGKYTFNCLIELTNIGASHTALDVILTTTNRTYYLDVSNPFNMQNGGALVRSYSAVCDMNAGDTATLTLFVAGGAKTVGVYGAAAPDSRTYFSGTLYA
jgi:hypothetical protein